MPSDIARMDVLDRVIMRCQRQLKADSAPTRSASWPTASRRVSAFGVQGKQATSAAGRHAWPALAAPSGNPVGAKRDVVAGRGPGLRLWPGRPPDHGEPLAAQRASGLAVRRIRQLLVPRPHPLAVSSHPPAAQPRYRLDNLGSIESPFR